MSLLRADRHPATVAGWEYRRTPTVCDGIVIRWTRLADREVARPLEVSASRNGVLVSGHDTVQRSVDDLVDILHCAEAEHRRLREGGE